MSLRTFRVDYNLFKSTIYPDTFQWITISPKLYEMYPNSIEFQRQSNSPPFQSYFSVTLNSPSLPTQSHFSVKINSLPLYLQNEPPAGGAVGVYLLCKFILQPLLWLRGFLVICYFINFLSINHNKLS